MNNSVIIQLLDKLTGNLNLNANEREKFLLILTRLNDLLYQKSISKLIVRAYLTENDLFEDTTNALQNIKTPEAVENYRKILRYIEQACIESNLRDTVIYRNCILDKTSRF